MAVHAQRIARLCCPGAGPVGQGCGQSLRHRQHPPRFPVRDRACLGSPVVLRPALARLALAWALPHALLERLPGQRRLGWLAAGVDATHLPFLTLYSESSLADARLAIALGAFDEHP